MDFKKLIVKPDNSILSTLKLMDTLDKKLLIVSENDVFISLVSIGDIQRAIINNFPLCNTIFSILRKEIKVASVNDSFESVKQMMIEHRMEFCPVIDKDSKIINVYFWEDIFSSNGPTPAKQFNLPVIIMAGGMGTRLKPLTNVLPKPLIPIGEQTILEDIFDRFANHGCNTFYISVNYKAELIEYYIRNQKLPYALHFFKEEKPTGTAGSLSLLRGKIKETFFVSNCDILIEQDYSEILEYHLTNNNEITIVAALKHYPIDYGTIDTGKNGRLLKLDEKPELTFKINSGMYILEPHLLAEIPENKFFHITSLIEKILGRKGNVGVFPVSEKSWRDMGSWEELKQNMR